jgi:uncharacterized Fe-S cluster-containing radical SAM superfamily protein
MNAVAKLIDTAGMSAHLRERAIDVAARKILISRLSGSDQEADLTVPTNCKGYGRIRHFRQHSSAEWPTNPLPIVPACKALRLEPPDVMTAQVFQNAACAWRCWYCFVPYNLLSADPKRSEWLTAEQLVGFYRDEPDRPRIIDLSGGSPDLVPEWTPWMMRALTDAGLDKTTYLWTDDNLSTRYLFDKVERADQELMRRFPNYGRVCCFKGFDANSFSFNTRAEESAFDEQFEIMRRLLEWGLDIYGYVTFTAPNDVGLTDAMPRFVDRLQALDPNLPLRVVPLEIREFTPVGPRMDSVRKLSLEVQRKAIAAWTLELERRFDTSLRALDVARVPLAHGAKS